MNINYANLRGVKVPGNSSEKNGSSLCRRCAKEKEIPVQPFQFATNKPKSPQIETPTYQFVAYECFEEVHAFDQMGSNRFIDIVAFKKNSHEAYISYYIDPTIRYETNAIDQAEYVNEEKKNIYESCIPFTKEKYRRNYGSRNFTAFCLAFLERYIN